MNVKVKDKVSQTNFLTPTYIYQKNLLKKIEKIENSKIEIEKSKFKNRNRIEIKKLKF